MDWEPVYLCVFRCAQGEDQRRKDLKEILSVSGSQSFEENSPFLVDLLSDMLKQAKLKRPSLAPTASCRAFSFAAHEESGREDQILCDALLNSVSLSSFRAHAEILAQRYLRTPKSRNGLLFILNANVMQGKNLTPALIVIKSDFRYAALLSEQEALTENHEVFLPELKKCLWYPHHDGVSFHLDQVRIFQTSNSDYFEKILKLTSLPDSIEIAEDVLRAELTEIHPQNYEKYFQIPEQERHAKRELFGENRYIAEEDLLDDSKVRHLCQNTQMRTVDQNVRPLKLKLKIDSTLRFEGNIDQLGSSYFFARNGLEKVLILRGDRFETSSHFQPAEFLRLEPVETVLKRMSESPVHSDPDDENS